MPKPFVSIITINYNQSRITCELLASLRRITYPNVEVIVVDNASPTEDPAPIEKRFPEVQLIRSRENLGFAGGNNLGIRVARGKYALFLNNDTEVEPDFLEPLVELLETKPEVGLASPKIIYYGSDHIVQYAGCEGINPWTGRGTVIGYMEKDKGQFNRSFPTQLIHGAAMMAPMSAIRKVGLMPEIYFLYYEELDWCEMLKRAGYQCYYEAGSTIYHKESMSVGKGSLMRTYYMYRNRLLFIRRNNRGVKYWIGLLFFLFAAMPKKGLVFAMNSEWDHFKAIWRGLRWHLQGHDIQHNDFLLP